MLNAHLPSRFRRVVAAVGAALVVLLGVATVSPVVHDHLHEDASHASTGPHTCAVVLFASGVTLAVAAIALQAPPVAWRACVAPSAAEIFLVVPRYLRQPERGPPDC